MGLPKERAIYEGEGNGALSAYLGPADVHHVGTMAEFENRT